MSEKRTLFEKVWDEHVVSASVGQLPLLFIDLHLVHEVTSPQAFDGLRTAGRKVRQPHRTVATVDHNVPSTPRGSPITDPIAARQISALQQNCKEFGVPLFDMDSPDQGIVHVIGPELGLTKPGMTVVCGDSHTSTHGAFGALAFGIGTSEVAHVLATQCLLQRKPKTMRVSIEGALQPGVTAKDVILAVIAKLGVGGGTGSVIEYAGRTVSAMSIEERMTVCNMSIEAGARAGMIGSGAWQTDEGARFDREIAVDVSRLAPMITWGTDPGTAIPVDGNVPEDAPQKSATYMGVKPGAPLLGTKIDVVFVGSCTNGRLSDLRAAASVLRGRRIASGVRVLLVPSSPQVKRAAERQGHDYVLREAP